MSPELKYLERVFAAEIEGRLPFQARPSKMLTRLADDGLIQTMKCELGRDRFGAITVVGWQLTHAGRLLYCASCDGDVQQDG